MGLKSETHKLRFSKFVSHGQEIRILYWKLRAYVNIIRSRTIDQNGCNFKGVKPIRHPQATHLKPGLKLIIQPVLFGNSDCKKKIDHNNLLNWPWLFSV